MHLLNAFFPIVVTDDGIDTLSNNVHPQKEFSPIVVILCGIAICLNSVLFSNKPEVS